MMHYRFLSHRKCKSSKWVICFKVVLKVDFEFFGALDNHSFIDGYSIDMKLKVGIFVLMRKLHVTQITS
jgi:hypothetical protein